MRVYSKCFATPFVSGPSSREKHLDNFFKIYDTGFWRLNLATRLRLIPVAKNASFAQIGLNSRQFSKTFQFFPTSRAVSLSCLSLPLPKQPFSLTKPPFSSSILHQSSRKGMSFLLFSKYFMFLALVFLDFVFLLKFENMMLEYGLLLFC